MARIRTIKPEFFSHEELAATSPHARLLAIGLLTLADCEGRLRWVPMQVHAQVFPWEAPGEAFENIEVLLSELLGCGYVVHYEAEGKRYVEVVNFTKHQRLSGKEAKYKSRLPAPPSDQQKPSNLPEKTGEATGKQLGASLGSGGEPLGTGEQGNRGTIGTGEQGNHRNSVKAPKAEVTKPPIIDQQSWDDWKATRRAKRAGPITHAVLRLLGKEAEKAGVSIQEAVDIAAGSGWITFKAHYGDGSGTGRTPKTFAQIKQENTNAAFERVFGNVTDAEKDSDLAGTVRGIRDGRDG